VDKQFNEADAKLTERPECEVEWEKLSRCVSDSEAMARDIQNQLALLPATPRRKNEIKALSFPRFLLVQPSIFDTRAGENPASAIGGWAE
jgi:hypothetical protein